MTRPRLDGFEKAKQSLNIYIMRPENIKYKCLCTGFVSMLGGIVSCQEVNFGEKLTPVRFSKSDPESRQCIYM